MESSLCPSYVPVPRLLTHTLALSEMLFVKAELLGGQ